MKRLVVLALFSGLTVFGQESTIDNVQTRLCDFWKYDFGSKNYVCSFLSPVVTLVEAPKHEQTIARLENRIAELEERLERLEKAP